MIFIIFCFFRFFLFCTFCLFNMSPMTVGKDAGCDHTHKHPPDTYIDTEILKSITNDARVLPLFEKRVYEITRMRNYSLQTNTSLRSAWALRLRHLEGRKRTPFLFPKPEDFHFYKHQTLYVPSQSFVNRAQLKMITFGQGGAIRGYAPVPVEMHTRKTAVNVRKPRDKSPKIIWRKRQKK